MTIKVRIIGISLLLFAKFKAKPEIQKIAL